MDEIDFPITLGEWLKRRRKELDLTQAELAQRVGCSLPALHKIEVGERRPSKQLAGLLAEALGIPAEDQTNFIRAARGEFNRELLRSPAPAYRAGPSVGSQPHPARINLPVQSTSLIGREAELDTLANRLSDPRCRFLSITGMGGIGKTRLAIELASRQQALYPGGVYFVPLASLDSAEFIAPAIADVLGFSLSGVLDPQEQLLNYLTAHAGQALLLVLDNLEHLLNPPDPANKQPDAILLLTALLRRLPNLTILATSREQIGVQGEWVFELQGLPVPTGDPSLRLEDSSAAALFLQRARQVKRDFVVLPEERSSLARVCQWVEGTPLALELAAAWVGMLSMEDIAHEIDSNLDFLTTTWRDVPERHRSLRATFDHSWKLLSVEEQQGLRRLAVFRGGFQREAADRVAGASLLVLMSLFSKSLILRQENGRYDLHEVVRQYALSHLTNDPQYEATLFRHCETYLRFVQSQEKALEGAAQFNALQALGKELDNLRAAMSWSLSQKKDECALCIATGLGQFWITQGYWREGLEWLERGLRGTGPVAEAVRAKALTLAGWLSRYLGDFSRAIAMLEESLALWRRMDARSGLALTLCNLGASVLRRGETAYAIDLLEEALSLSKRQDDRFGMVFSLEILGHAASRQGNSQEAIEFYNQALPLARQANDENEMMKLFASIGYEYVILGDYDRAEHWFDQAESISQRLSNRMVAAFITTHRGWIAMKKGDYPTSFHLLAESILASHELGDKEEAVLSLEPIAFIAKEQGFPARAARLLGASESLRKGIGVIRSQPIQANYDTYTAEVLAALGEAAFAEAWAEGSKMTYQQAIDYAVDPNHLGNRTSG